MEQWYKLAVVAKQTGIPYQSLSRYIDRHSAHLQLKREHKSRLLNKESISTIEKIRKHYEHGMTESQVEKELSMSDIPVVLEMDEGNENELGTLGNILQEMHQALGSVNEKLEQQQKFNQELLRRLDSQQAYIEKLETKPAEEQPAIEAPKKKWWQFRK